VRWCAQVPGATGDYRTEFHAKAAAVADELVGGEHDFVFLHVKAVDDTGHDRHPAQKVAITLSPPVTLRPNPISKSISNLTLTLTPIPTLTLSVSLTLTQTPDPDVKPQHNPDRVLTDGRRFAVSSHTDGSCCSLTAPRAAAGVNRSDGTESAW